MAASSSPERMRTGQQGTRIIALPSDLIEKMVTTVGGKSPNDAFNCQLVDYVTSDAIYKTIDTNRLRFRPFSVHMYEVLRRCRKLNNPHICWISSMVHLGCMSSGQFDRMDFSEEFGLMIHDGLSLWRNP
uniref:Uncharacterized protein n=1 Tax=Lactuca sativa TaxID=4236 RepID=A0A9R1V7U4_LACSA|nr:hypothetical protein LSAT_V11C600313650 [Lactuca sativa]